MQWAETYFNLGLALSDQAGQSERADAGRLLGEAVAAYTNALTIYSAEHFPYHHTLATNNLALAEEALRKLKL